MNFSKNSLCDKKHKYQLINYILAIIALLVVFNSTQPAYAQRASKEFFANHARFLSIYKQDIKDIAVEYTIHQERDSKDSDLSFDLSTIKFDTDLVLPASKDLFFRGGLEYTYRDYDFSFQPGIEFGEPNFKMRLHRGLIHAGIGYFINSNILFTTFVDAGLASDFEDGISSDAFVHEFQADLAFQVNPGAQLLFGVRRGYEFEDFSIYPILGIRLIGTEAKLRLSATLPIEAKVQYRFAQWLDSYALIKLSGEEYSLGFAPGNQEGEINIYERRVATGVQLLPGSLFVLQVELGLSVDDSIDFDLNRTESKARSTDVGAYASLSIGFSL